MQIFVKGLGSLDVEGSFTVEHAKILIHEKFGTPDS